ncbi:MULTISPECIES: YciI family protein [Amycolatopsis]|uniref:YCII-related domain-containing protein n=1 Tax=Amycolatopsis viridis TaxID=185678 RepID=A0ABX0SPC9_9PSEU|nr:MULTISPECIES: YciI family protein [Amycolatopsis]NIH78403.1 hypothetical protein [Amycolatopsis viridis]NIH87038.1 hypothetical protein [Amycolatopsis granulosa]
MKFMVLVKASEETEAGVLPTEQELTAMGKFNEELVKAGVLLAAEGLHPSSKGVRLKYTNEGTSVIDGPFAETKELLAGFWILDVKSREEAVEWLKRAPFEDAEIEIRQVFAPEDFGEAYTPELREAEERMRQQSAEQHGR